MTLCRHKWKIKSPFPANKEVKKQCLKKADKNMLGRVAYQLNREVAFAPFPELGRENEQDNEAGVQSGKMKRKKKGKY